MRTLIVYYSLEGNTAQTAEKIAAITGADLLRLEPVREYPTGNISKLVWGGKAVVFGDKPKLKPYTFHASDYDRIIIGSPVWASTFAPPFRTFFRDNDLSGKRYAAFFCQMQAGAEKAFVKLREALGTDRLDAELTLIDPKVSPDPANDQKIREFCEKLS